MRTTNRLQQTRWAAIRICKNAGYEWLDTENIEFNYTAELAQTAATTLDARLPDWAIVNPVVRIVLIEIKPLKR